MAADSARGVLILALLAAARRRRHTARMVSQAVGKHDALDDLSADGLWEGLPLDSYGLLDRAMPWREHCWVRLPGAS